MIGKERRPPIDGAGHRHRVRRLHLDRRDALGRVPLGCCRRWRATGSIEPNQFLAGLCDDNEAVAPDTRHRMLDDREHGRSRQCRIHRIAALPHDLDGRLRRERM